MTIQEIAIDQPAMINADRMHEEMQAALGAKYVSMDSGFKLTKESTDNKIKVRLTEDATTEDKQAAAAVVDAHKPELLSTTQQRAKDRAEAYERLKAHDFTALRAAVGKAQIDTVIDLLEDIQRMMRGVENG